MRRRTRVRVVGSSLLKTNTITSELESRAEQVEGKRGHLVAGGDGRRSKWSK